MPTSSPNPFNPPTAVEPVMQPKTNSFSMSWYQWFVLKVAKTLRAPCSLSAPPTAASPGTAGQIATDGTYFYVCVATNTWKRTASPLTSF